MRKAYSCYTLEDFRIECDSVGLPNPAKRGSCYHSSDKGITLIWYPAKLTMIAEVSR